MKINWRKTFTIALDVVIGGYLILAFTAFNKPDETVSKCNKVSINIQDETTNGFINTKEIKRRLEQNKLYPLEKPMKEISARNIEDALKATPFVKAAECYKTQDGHVCITLTQRMPTVRIKAANGDDYYIDDKNSIMPNSHYTSDLIIATGNISRWYAQNYISHLNAALCANDLWRNQIVQIHVLPDKGVELVPRVGKHVIYIGPLPEINYKSGRKKLIEDFVKKKMERLLTFYKYGLSQAGWNKYNYINLEFDNQIICKKNKSHN